MKKSFVKFAALTLAAAACTAAFSGCGNSAAAAGKSRLEQIKERGYIEVATEPYFAPNEFIDSSKEGDDKYVGSDIELAKAIADEIGVSVKIIPLEFSAVLASVTEGKYDLAISALAWTPNRAENMEMSKGYHYSDTSLYTVLVREEDKDNYKSLDDLKGKKVVCQSGSLQEQLIKDAMDIKELNELLYVSATTDGYLYAAANGGLTTIPDAINFPVSSEYDGTRVGAPKGETELIDVVNTVIDQLSETDQYNKWYEEYSEYAEKLGLE